MNKKLKRKKLNTNKGITLIALILTIIVLLILAVVAIQAVKGDGILAHARNARAEYQNAQNNEAATLKDYEDYLIEQNGGVVYKKVPVGTEAANNGTINGEAPSADNPIIPKGFIPINTDTSTWGDGSGAPDEDSVQNGLVITDSIDESTKASNGNEFVWIPVPDLSKFAVYKATAESKDKNGRINYRGVLYNFQSNKSNNTTKDWSDTGSREPDNLSNTYDSESNLSVWTSILYQESFNAMVESVAKYKGFYVGRYEMSSEGGSKKDVTSLKNTDSTYNWYGLYSEAKKYAQEKSNITSEMIWGCQYDAMMRWMQENEIDVTSTAPTDTGRSKQASYNDGTITGGKEDDRLNNVYDLLGNKREWTQEASNTTLRVYRGGYCDSSGSPSIRFSSASPTYAGADACVGSRLTLYAK